MNPIAPPLTGLRVVVKPEMPRDELWVHPEMMDLLYLAFWEAESARSTYRWINGDLNKEAT